MSNNSNDPLAFLTSLGLDDYAEGMRPEPSRSTCGSVVTVLGDTALLSGGIYHLAEEELALLKQVRELGDEALYVRFDDVAMVPEDREGVSLSCLEAVASLWGEGLANVLILTPGISLHLNDEERPMLAHAMQWLRVALRSAPNPPAVLILDPYVERAPSPAYRTLRRFSDKTL